MRIGIVCYASVGGSGVVATELAHALVQRRHRVHLISSERPFRWRDGMPDLFFERVEMLSYPLFREPQYLLALATSSNIGSLATISGNPQNMLVGRSRWRSGSSG